MYVEISASDICWPLIKGCSTIIWNSKSSFLPNPSTFMRVSGKEALCRAILSNAKIGKTKYSSPIDLTSVLPLSYTWASPPLAISLPNNVLNVFSVWSNQQPTAFAQSSIRFSCCAPHWTSLLKLPIGAVRQSDAISAPASMVAMTLFVPPAAQPCCSACENRWYTSFLVINHSA